MNNIILPVTVAVIFAIIQYFKTRVNKEEKDIREIGMQTILVMLSVVVGDFLLTQVYPTLDGAKKMLAGGGGAAAFANDPGF